MHPADAAPSSDQATLVRGLDARIKLMLLFAFLLSIALLPILSPFPLLAAFVYLILIAWAAHLPFFNMLRRSLIVVPFIGVFSLIIYFSGDARRALDIIAKSYLSTLSVILCMSVTPMAELVNAGRFFHIPGLLLDVIQLVYRYFFVLAEDARSMQAAFASRGGRPGKRAIQASAGMVAVLFSRSYEKAATIHHCMCARGFLGTLPGLEFESPEPFEFAILAVNLLLIALLHFA